MYSMYSMYSMDVDAYEKKLKRDPVINYEDFNVVFHAR